MQYQPRMDKVIDYIGQHLDEKLTLEMLSNVACFSKFHFHRLFAAYTGLSLKNYIRWLRLKRAAHQLIINKDTPILEIAINAGFESHEAFTRAFKKSCGFTPTEFRMQSSWHAWETPPYCLPSKGEMIMNVEIKEMPARRLAIMEHRGDVSQLGDTVYKLVTWAKAQPIDLKPKSGEAFGFGYDDPKLTSAEDFRFDLGISVPENFKLDDKVKEKRLPAGRYAVAVHKGSRDNIGDTIYPMYRDWMLDSAEEPADLPCIFRYMNFEHEVAETEAITEICILLK